MRRRKRLLRQLRVNMTSLGDTTVDKLSDEELEKIATDFGSLEQMVAITDPAAQRALSVLAPSRLKADPEPQPVDRYPGGSHDEAGELLHLIGGPMNDVFAREGAPALEASWSKDGRYVRTDDKDRDELPIALWVPA